MIVCKGLIVGLVGLSFMGHLSPGLAETAVSSQEPSKMTVTAKQNNPHISPGCGGNPPVPYPTPCGSPGIKQVCNGVGDCCAITNTTCLDKGRR
jgi:hypothetical protein